MSVRRVRAVFVKELKHIVRDVRSLIMAVGLPAFLLVFFGFAISLDVDRIPTMISDADGSAASRDLIGRFLEPVTCALNTKAAKALLDLQIDPIVQRRVDRLAEKANEGELTDAERDEYETYIIANDLVSIMQLRARRLVTSSRR